ncbi:hypothetical protein MKX33_00730 [Paenibacillus sp. FSL R5-0490]
MTLMTRCTAPIVLQQNRTHPTHITLMENTLETLMTIMYDT